MVHKVVLFNMVVERALTVVDSQAVRTRVRGFMVYVSHMLSQLILPVERLLTEVTDVRLCVVTMNLSVSA